MNKKLVSVKKEILKDNDQKVEKINLLKEEISLYQKWLKIINDSNPGEKVDLLSKLNEAIKEQKIKFDSLDFAEYFMKMVIPVHEKEIKGLLQEYNPLLEIISKLEPYGLAVIKTTNGIKIICNKETDVSKLLASSIHDEEATTHRLELNNLLHSQIEKLKPSDVVFDLKKIELDFSNPNTLENTLELIESVKMSYSRDINKSNTVQIILSKKQHVDLADNLTTWFKESSSALLRYFNPDYPID